MHYMYVLENESGELYFGYTNDLKRRLVEHNTNKSFATKNHQWELVYYEAYKSQQDARTREQRIKNYGQTWRQLRERFADSRRHES